MIRLLIMADILLVLFLHFAAVNMFEIHNKPIPKKLWEERCDRNSRILNDCNWCTCDANHHYVCTARICETVDMFGHFNDAIRDLHIGMEGHGVWRSTQQACEAGVQYQRDALICLCSENGVWPNPTCRDIFRVMHSVEPISKEQLTQSKACSPTKLYLIGCNVCFCPSTGILDPELCTKEKCRADDPVLTSSSISNESRVLEQEIYAVCDENVLYRLGCRNCKCLRNNRLYCDKCDGKDTSVFRAEDIVWSERICKGKEVDTPFQVDCNFCYCDKHGNSVCTKNVCVDKHKQYIFKEKIPEEPRGSYRFTNAVKAKKPNREEHCAIGSKYLDDCNTCYCFYYHQTDKHVSVCSKNRCKNQTAVDYFTKNKCTVGEVYFKSDCLMCRCEIKMRGQLWEYCLINSTCKETSKIRESPKLEEEMEDLENLDGFCEPNKYYARDCNICRCLANGRVVICTTKECDAEQKPIEVDLIPVTQVGPKCPKGHSYKVDCNYCFCLTNGNALCTTVDCGK